MACKSLDGQVVRPEDPELTRLLEQFVPVRITNFKEVDQNRFKFDYDLTFAVLMMDPNGKVYSRWGTQDERMSSDRMSIAGLKAAMRAVLGLNQAAVRAGLPPAPAPAKPFTMADIPTYARSPAVRQECAHCHQAKNFRTLQELADGTLDKRSLYQYPLPENLGLVLDVDATSRVRSVLPGTPAAKAGIQPGDVLVRVNDVPVTTDADLQFVLNGIPDPGTATLRVRRGGKELPPATLALPAGWRKTDLSWRASLGAVPPAPGIATQPLNEAEKARLGIAADRMALRVTRLFPGAQFASARGTLAENDVLVGVNGMRFPAMDQKHFVTWCRLNLDIGASATLNVLRGGQPVAIPIRCVDPNRPNPPPLPGRSGVAGSGNSADGPPATAPNPR